MSFVIEVLDKNVHHLRKFNCGKTVMDIYLRQFADKNHKLGISRTWVMADRQTAATGKHPIAGYFTLSVQSVAPAQLDNPALPAYPAPVTLLARLAVDKAYQGQKIGSRLLFAALQQAWQAHCHGLPSYAVVLDVLDDDARRFYDQFEFFRALDDSGTRLFVPMAVIGRLMAQR